MDGASSEPVVPHDANGGRPSSLATLSGWQRAFVLFVLVWTTLVAAFTLAMIIPSASPFDTESEIKSRWVDARIALIRQYQGGMEPIAAIRHRLYGDASDDEILDRAESHPRDGTSSIAVPAEASQGVDNEFSARLAARRDRSRILWIVLGYWLLPIAVVFLFANAVDAVAAYGKASIETYRRFRSGSKPATAGTPSRRISADDSSHGSSPT